MANNKPFLRYLLPMFRHETLCKAIHMKMTLTLICMKMIVQVKNIFTKMLSQIVKL